MLATFTFACSHISRTVVARNPLPAKIGPASIRIRSRVESPEVEFWGIGAMRNIDPRQYCPLNLGGFADSEESHGICFPNNCIKHLFNHNVICIFLLVFEMKEGGLCGIWWVLKAYMSNDIFSSQAGDSLGCGIQYAIQQFLRRIWAMPSVPRMPS